MTSSPVAPAERPMPANERLVLDMFRAVEQRDLDRILEIYAPDVEFVWPAILPGYGGTYRGEEALPMSQAFADAWDPLQPSADDRAIHPRIIGSNDDEVVVLYRQRGVDPDGRTCESEVLGLYTVKGDHVSRLQMFYFDPVAVAEFLSD